ncbi:MAG: hypothetical protein R3321_13455, partial [Nitrososphaeraceae archaeon]|nr:hypothetical protein [Nitrososphaeraceae archaeon]
IAFQKKKSNWIESDQIIKIHVGESKLINFDYLSDPSYLEDRYLMAEIPFGSDGKFYTVEARKDSRFDHIPNNYGLMVYEFDLNRPRDSTVREFDSYAPLSAAKSNLLDCLEYDNGICKRANYDELSVTTGESFTDNENGIKIQPVSMSGTSLLVCILNFIENPPPEILIESHYSETSNSLNIHIEFWDCTTGELIPNVEYDLSVTQNGESILYEDDFHDENGIIDHSIEEIPQVPSEINPIIINVELYDDSISQNNITKNARVIPEFETMTLVILSISIITVIVLTGKTKLNLSQ